MPGVIISKQRFKNRSTWLSTNKVGNLKPDDYISISITTKYGKVDYNQGEKFIIINIVKKSIHIKGVLNYIKKYKDIFEKAEWCSISKKSKRTNSGVDNEDKVISRFNNGLSIEYKRYILKELERNENEYENWTAYKSIKEHGIILSYTNYWIEYKKGTKETSPRSKSDIILKNNITGEIIPISIKSGDARLTSADCYESNALFMSVLYKFNTKYNTNNLLMEKIENLINIMKSIEKFSTLPGYNYTKVKKCIKCNNIPEDLKPTVKWIDTFEGKTLEMNSLWKDIKKISPDYIEDLLFECARGYHKFGENNSRADYLIELESTKSTEIKNIYILKNKNEKIKSYLKKHGNGNVFKIKTSGVRWWPRFL